MSSIKLSGKVFKVESSRLWEIHPRPGVWWIAERRRPDGSLQRRRIAVFRKKKKIWANVGGSSFFGEELSENRSVSEGSDSDLHAQFPGKVRKVLVKVGDRVNEGDPLVFLEAMKMEFSIKAPYSGVVSEVLIQDGQQVSPGDPLVYLKKGES